MSSLPGQPTQVELTDDDVAPGARGESGPGAPGAASRRWWAAGLVLALGVVLVGSAQLSATADRQDADDVARLADQPGFAGSLREPLVPLWDAPDRLVGAGAGVVLVEDRTAAPPALLVARDAATGRTRWTGRWASLGGVTHCGPVDTVLLCEVLGSGFGGPNTDELLGEVPGRLLAVRPEDGRLLGEVELDGRTVGWAPADDDVVLARRDGERLTVSRRVVPDTTPDEDARWTQVWSASVPLPTGVTANQLSLRVEAGLVVVEGRWGVVLDAADGATVVAPTQQGAAGGPVRVVVSSAGVGVWTTEGTGTWTAREGRRTATLTGEPVVESPRDGSAPQVLLLERASGLVAVDAPTGAVLWERPPEPWRRVARVAGAVLVVEPGRVVALDARTGAPAWRRPLPTAPGGAPPAAATFLLDARRVLLGDALTGEGLMVVDLADGVQLWSRTPGVPGLLRPGTGAAVVLSEAGGRTTAWGPARP